MVDHRQAEQPGHARISGIAEEAWTSIGYPRGGEAQIAETEFDMINPEKRSHRIEVRLVVRRTSPRRSPGAVLARLVPSRVRYQPEPGGVAIGLLLSTATPSITDDRHDPHDRAGDRRYRDEEVDRNENQDPRPEPVCEENLD